MNRKAVVAMLLAVPMLTSGFALAQMDGDVDRDHFGKPYHRQGNTYRDPLGIEFQAHGRSGQAQALDDRRAGRHPANISRPNRGYPHYSNAQYGYPDAGYSNRGYADQGPVIRDGRWVAPGGEIRPQFYRGARLPAEYWHANHVVDDWRSRNLKAPPRGHQWFQTGDNYLLVALGTGVIVHVMFDN